MAAYEADYVTQDGQLVIDDPEIRQKLVKAIDSYTAIYRKGCTPPDSVTWDDYGNNKAFLAQTVVMTPNVTLSIPNALKRERPDDYYKNTATIEWPLGPHGEPFPIVGDVSSAVVFKDGGNVATAKEFVRFLVAEGWLAHYLDFSGERMLPPMSKLLDQPFWLDPSDPHRMASVMQVRLAPAGRYDYAVASGNWRHEPGLRGTRLGEGGPSHRRPRASAPSRRSTRRSPGSSRSWRSERSMAAARRELSSPAAMLMAPLGARAADLVVWWEKGFYPQEDAAVREIIAAFEQETGKQVELVLPSAET